MTYDLERAGTRFNSELGSLRTISRGLEPAKSAPWEVWGFTGEAASALLWRNIGLIFAASWHDGFDNDARLPPAGRARARN